jgi:transcriptional regulator with XRE-family HTH domain
MTLAERIRDARTRVGLSQVELAKKCGIAAPSINQLESGKSKSMRQATLLRMAKAVGQSPEWLAFGNGSLSELPPTSRNSTFEQEFLADFRRLSATERKVVVRMVRSLVMDR